MATIKRSTVGSFLIAALLYSIVGIATAYGSHPFEAARLKAAKQGGWDPECVYFKRGSFGWRFFSTKAEADLIVASSAGGESAWSSSVHIELAHTPFTGWMVSRFETSPTQSSGL